jgi:hypothetical protein
MACTLNYIATASTFNRLTGLRVDLGRRLDLDLLLVLRALEVDRRRVEALRVLRERDAERLTLRLRETLLFLVERDAERRLVLRERERVAGRRLVPRDERRRTDFFAVDLFDDDALLRPVAGLPRAVDAARDRPALGATDADERVLTPVDAWSSSVSLAVCFFFDEEAAGGETSVAEADSSASGLAFLALVTFLSLVAFADFLVLAITFDV